MQERLKAGLWVDSQIRQCNAQALPVYVVKRGDPDAGVVLVKLLRKGGTVLVLAPSRDRDGAVVWDRPLGADPVAEADGDAWLARQQTYDPDLWILEIEDPDERWDPTAPVL
jgi:hypothetical protein